MTYQRNETPEPVASIAVPDALWCEHCQKDDHRTAECWSTHAAIGRHDAKPADMQFPSHFAWPDDIAALSKA